MLSQFATAPAELCTVGKSPLVVDVVKQLLMSGTNFVF